MAPDDLRDRFGFAPALFRYQLVKRPIIVSDDDDDAPMDPQEPDALMVQIRRDTGAWRRAAPFTPGRYDAAVTNRVIWSYLERHPFTVRVQVQLAQAYQAAWEPALAKLN